MGENEDKSKMYNLISKWGNRNPFYVVIVIAMVSFAYVMGSGGLTVGVSNNSKSTISKASTSELRKAIHDEFDFIGDLIDVFQKRLINHEKRISRIEGRMDENNKYNRGYNDRYSTK